MLNNQAVDETIENFVKNACTLDQRAPRTDKLELDKTTRLLFLSTLIMGEREIDEFADHED